jgi:hypothetical protein
MKTHLHKLPEGFIVTSDEKPIKDDLCFDLEGSPGYNNQLYIVKCLRTADDSYWAKNTKKIIAQQHQLTFSDDIPEEKLREIGWIDIEKLALHHNDYFGEMPSKIYDREGFYQVKNYIAGFQKALELLSDRRFTEEDMLKFYYWLKKSYGPTKPLEEAQIVHRTTPDKIVEMFAQSLSQPKCWEVEIEKFCGSEDCILFGCQKYEGCKHPEIQQPKLTNGKIKITKIL